MLPIIMKIYIDGFWVDYPMLMPDAESVESVIKTYEAHYGVGNVDIIKLEPVR